MRSVRYLGFIFGGKEIRTDPDKISWYQFISFLHPRIGSRSDSFWASPTFTGGLCTRNMSELSLHSHHWHPKRFPSNGTWNVDNVFEKVKITSTPVRVHPDFSIPFHIHRNTSGLGVGAVISQYVNTLLCFVVKNYYHIKRIGPLISWRLVTSFTCWSRHYLCLWIESSGIGPSQSSIHQGIGWYLWWTH